MAKYGVPPKFPTAEEAAAAELEAAEAAGEVPPEEVWFVYMLCVYVWRGGCRWHKCITQLKVTLLPQSLFIFHSLQVYYVWKHTLLGLAPRHTLQGGAPRNTCCCIDKGCDLTSCTCASYLFNHKSELALAKVLRGFSCQHTHTKSCAFFGTHVS